MATGIYRRKYGYLIAAKANGHEQWHRIAYTVPDAFKRAQAWQAEARSALMKKTPIVTGNGRRGSFPADVKEYLAIVKPLIGLATYRSRVCELDAYVIEFRNRARSEIARSDLLALRTAWLTKEPGKRKGSKGVTIKTVRNREGALRHLFHILDGKKAPTPLDDLPKLPKPEPNPQFVEIAVIRSVLRKLTDPKTRARFMVLTATGQRPAQLKRAQKPDVDLRRRVWSVRRAKGGNPIPVILTDDMVKAFKALNGADAWGDFDGSDYAKALYAAGWPKHIRPYNAKHTVAITLAEAGAEWNDIKDFFGHKDVKTTEIYTGLVRARLRQTSKKLEGRFGWKT